MGWGDIAGAVGKSFASSGKNADGSTNPYAGVGQSALSGLFGMLGAKGQSDDQQKLMDMQMQQGRDSNVSTLQQSIMGDTLARDKMYADRNPIGAEQQYMQQQQLRDILLQKMMAPQGMPLVNSGAQAILDKIGYKPFTPTLRDGWDTGPSVFGKDASLGALGTFNQGNAMLTQGRGPQTNLGATYGQSDTTDRIQGEMGQYNQSASEPRMQQQKWLQDAIDSRNAAAAPQQKSGGNIFSKILKGAGGVASFIPGIGQIAAPALSFAGGMAGGDGWKKSLGSAALSAVPMGLGKLGGAIGGTAGSIMGKIADPMGIGGGAKSTVQNAITNGVGAFGQTFQPRGGGFMGGQPQAPQFQNQFAQEPQGFQYKNSSFGAR